MAEQHLKNAISYNKNLKKYLIRIPETLNVNDQIAAAMRKNIRDELFDNFVEKLTDKINSESDIGSESVNEGEELINIYNELLTNVIIIFSRYYANLTLKLNKTYKPISNEALKNLSNLEKSGYFLGLKHQKLFKSNTKFDYPISANIEEILKRLLEIQIEFTRSQIEFKSNLNIIQHINGNTTALKTIKEDNEKIIMDELNKLKNMKTNFQLTRFFSKIANILYAINNVQMINEKLNYTGPPSSPS